VTDRSRSDQPKFDFRHARGQTDEIQKQMYRRRFAIAIRHEQTKHLAWLDFQNFIDHRWVGV
jgi:hypothetical protein